MKSRLSALSLVVLAAVTASLMASCGGKSSAGCRLRSVDKDHYVAQNEVVFKTVPVPGGVVRVNTYSIGIPAPNACFPGHENGPPYSAFDTWHVYSPPGQMSGAAVLRFYHRALQPAWTWRGGATNDATFRRGNALLYVSVSADAILLSVDYQGYAGPGH